MEEEVADVLTELDQVLKVGVVWLERSSSAIASSASATHTNTRLKLLNTFV